MKSFLLSSLVGRFASGSWTDFQHAHPHEWLLWEPGSWRPSQRTTMVMEKVDPAAAPKGGEALALVMALKKGQEQLILGRGDECDLLVNDATLSQKHLVFMRVREGTWTVRDAGSRNGSWVDGLKLDPGQPVTLRSGAKLRAAQVQLTYYGPAEMFGRLVDAGTK